MKTPQIPTKRVVSVAKTYEKRYRRTWKEIPGQAGDDVEEGTEGDVIEGAGDDIKSTPERFFDFFPGCKFVELYGSMLLLLYV